MRVRELRIDGGMTALFAATAGKPHAFFLESALPAGGLGRYSFIGFNPIAVFRVDAGGGAEVRWADGRAEPCAGEPLEALRELHERLGTGFARDEEEERDGRAVPFAGGAVGFFSYEFGLRFEGVKRTRADDLGLPEAEWAFYDGVVACEQTDGRIFAATNRQDTDEAERVLDRIEREVREVLREASDTRETEPLAGARGYGEIAANFSQADYERAVLRVKEYIAAGDVYQVNLSQRFAAPLRCAPAELYQRLRRRSPAPFGCFLNFGNV